MDHFDHHYVPQFLLRQFAGAPGLIWKHSFLASHSTVRTWNLVSIREQAAVNRHLYTVVEDAKEDDRIERWLEKEFETPAAEAVDRVIQGEPLKPVHYRNLARLFAAQDRRTPRAYMESMRYWERESPLMLQSIGQDLNRLNVTQEDIEKVAALFPPELRPEALPLSFKQTAENETKVNFDLGLTAGRKLWLWDLLHCLRTLGPIRALQSHQWTILRMPDGLHLPITDSPTIKLGLDNNGSRSYGGGWNSDGTVLMMPLSPSHLLFSEVGRKRPSRDTVLPRHKAEEVIAHLVRRAFRDLYSHSPELNVDAIRKRIIDPEVFRREKQAGAIGIKFIAMPNEFSLGVKPRDSLCKL